MVAMLRSATGERPAEVLTLNILSNRGRTIRPKTLNQKRYVDAIDRNTIVFGIGPAGTGKTYLAMAKAVQALQAKQVTRIILTRPAVEAGERLGFLPGTLYEKIDPYLRPLYDALHDMVDPESIPRLMTAGTIEVAPLAYMRGRAQPVETPVLTPDGFRPIGSLRVGDLVIGSTGGRRRSSASTRRASRRSTGSARRTERPRSRAREHLWARHDTRMTAPREAGRVLETQRDDRHGCGTLTTAGTSSRSCARSSSSRGRCRWSRTRSACSWATVASPDRTTPSFSTERSRAGRRARRLRCPASRCAQDRPRLCAATIRRRRGGLLVANPVTATLRDLGLCRHAVRRRSSSRRLSISTAPACPARRAPGSSRHRRRPGPPGRPHLPDPVLDLFGPVCATTWFTLCVRSGGVAYCPASARPRGASPEGKGAAGPPPARRAHPRHSPSCRHGAVPARAQEGALRRGRWRSADALHRQHRARRRRGVRVHRGRGRGLALRHGGLPRDAQHPQRRVHHPRRGAEHLRRADEDVPHPARLRLEDGRHRRRHPGRPAERHAERPARRAGHPGRHRRRALLPAVEPGRRTPPAGQRHRRRLRPVRRRHRDADRARQTGGSGRRRR